jgi:hypothetical protein
MMFKRVSWYFGAGVSLVFGVACSDMPFEATDESTSDDVSRAEAPLFSTCSKRTTIKPFKELTIVHPSVVESADALNTTGTDGGALSFRRALKRLAGNQDLNTFTVNWLKTWATNQQLMVGGVSRSAEARSSVTRMLTPFGGFWTHLPGSTNEAPKLDFSQAPFRLLAVVNRVDLRDANKPNGEARLVYGATFGDKKMSVIFEFNAPANIAPRAWANTWHQLAALPFGPTFNTRLIDNVVNVFAKPENLAQLRTNELQFGTPWDLREFKLLGTPSVLTPAPVAQTPDISFNGAERSKLITWINDNRHDIASSRHVVPANMSGLFSRASDNRFSSDPFNGTQWLGGATIDPSLRHLFAQNTCNGCHQSDVPQSPGVVSAALQFYHVNPVSEIMTDPAKPDEDGWNRLSTFVRNVEFPFRSEVMNGLLSCSCIAEYKVDSRSGNTTKSSVKITNISSSPVKSWDVVWNQPSSETITSFQNAVAVAGQPARKFRFANTANNGSIQPGQSQSFSFDTSISELSPIPTKLFVTCGH